MIQQKCCRFYFNVYFQQAIGLLIGMEDVPLEKQSEYLSSLLTPLCQQVCRKTEITSISCIVVR